MYFVWVREDGDDCLTFVHWQVMVGQGIHMQGGLSCAPAYASSYLRVEFGICLATPAPCIPYVLRRDVKLFWPDCAILLYLP